MQNRRYQKGMSMWSMMGIAVVAGFFLLIVIKLVPTYLADFKVQSALKGIAEQAKVSPMTNFQVFEAIRKRFEIDDIDNRINPKDAVSFEKQGRSRIVKISYENVTPLFYNISLLVEFEHSAEVGTFEE